MKKIYSFELCSIDVSKDNMYMRKDFELVDNLALSEKKTIGKVLVYKTFTGYREIITKKPIPVLYKHSLEKYSLDINQSAFIFIDHNNLTRTLKLATDDEINEYIVNNCDPEKLGNFNYTVDPKKIYLDKLNELFKKAESDYDSVIEKCKYSDRYIINSFLRFKKIVNKKGNLIYENYRKVYSAKIASVNKEGNYLNRDSLENIRKDYSIKENVPSMPYKISDEIIYIYKDYNDVYREIITDIEIPIMEVKSSSYGWRSEYTCKLNKDKTYYVFEIVSSEWGHYSRDSFDFLPSEARFRVRTFEDFENYLYDKFKLNQDVSNPELINLYNEYLVKINYIINSSIEDYNQMVSKSDYSKGYEKVKIKEKADKLKKLYKI